MHIEFKEHISEELKNRAEQEQVLYESASGICCKYTPFYMVASQGEMVVGLVSGYTCYSEVYVDDIVVFKSYRKKGVGRGLMAAVENHFAGKNFNNINLVTNGFQAPQFYEKCGFTHEFTRHNKENPLLTKHFYVKFFGSTKGE